MLPQNPSHAEGNDLASQSLSPPGSKREKIMKSPVLLKMYYHCAFFVILQILQQQKEGTPLFIRSPPFFKTLHVSFLKFFQITPPLIKGIRFPAVCIMR